MIIKMQLNLYGLKRHLKKKNTTAKTFPLSVSTEPLSFGDGGERLTFLTSLTRWYSVLDGPCLCGEKHKNEAT